MQIVLPPKLIATILHTAHDSPLAGHMGVKKTLARILDNYYWPEIHKDVKKHIGKCVQCITKNYNHGKHKAPIQPTDKVGGTFKKLAMDIVGPLL